MALKRLNKTDSFEFPYGLTRAPTSRQAQGQCRKAWSGTNVDGDSHQAGGHHLRRRAVYGFRKVNAQSVHSLGPCLCKVFLNPEGSSE